MHRTCYAGALALAALPLAGASEVILDVTECPAGGQWVARDPNATYEGGLYLSPCYLPPWLLPPALLVVFFLTLLLLIGLCARCLIAKKAPPPDESLPKSLPSLTPTRQPSLRADI